MIREFVLTYAEAPKSLNAGGAGSRRHWGAAYREKKSWEDRYWALLISVGVPRGMTRCEAAATIRWKQERRRDSTNYTASIVKPFADVLVRYLYLPDDTDEFFMFSGLEFEYPKPWPYTDPRVKSELEIRLRAAYPDSQGDSDAR